MRGIGTDIQAISESAALANICTPGVFFTEGELENGGKHVVHNGDAGSEGVAVEGVASPSAWLIENRLRADVSISHSGDYATGVVLIYKDD